MPKPYLKITPKIDHIDRANATGLYNKYRRSVFGKNSSLKSKSQFLNAYISHDSLLKSNPFNVLMDLYTGLKINTVPQIISQQVINTTSL